MPQGTDGLAAQLVEALRKRGVSQPAIDRLSHYLRSRPAGSDPPCPSCFLQGREATLVMQTKVAGIAVMRCDACGDQMLLRTT